MATNSKVAEAKRAAERQVAAQRRKSLVSWIVIGIVVIAAFAMLVAYIVRQGSVSEVSGEGQLTPSIASENAGYGVAASGVVGEGLGEAPVRLDLYFDFMCPGCGGFEMYEADVLNELRADGTLEVYYHPMGNLDRLSMGTGFSTRSAAAAALIAEEAPEAFVDFVAGMFASQPEENTPGLSDEEIQQIALAAGVPQAVVDRIPLHEYESWVAVSTETGATDGAAYTPIIALDGEFQNTMVDAEAFNWAESETALHDEIVRRAQEASGS